MMNFGNCESTTRDPRISLKEKRSRIVFINPNRQKIRKIEIDGCFITEGIRCDWLLIDYNCVEHYVELKGSDVRHAIAQIERTIKKVSIDVQKQPKHSYVICKRVRVPRFDTELQTNKRKFKDHFNSTFIVKESGYEASF